MLRGDIWVTHGDRDAYVLIGSDHLRHTHAAPPVLWGIPITAETQPKHFTEPFVVPLTPSATGLDLATWVLVARGITPLPHTTLQTQLAALTPKAVTRVDQAIQLLYDLT